MPAVASKYARQIATVRARVKLKGTVCTWYKSADTDTSDDTSPEFPKNDDPKAYTETPIIFYPQVNVRYVAEKFIPQVGGPSDVLYAMIPGDVPFNPEVGDILECRGQKFTVGTINPLKPDLIPILYELSFQ